MADIKKTVLSKLRERKVKLWLPPYYSEENDEYSSGAFEALADGLARILSPQFSKEKIREAMKDLQSSAIQKLQKLEIEIKVLGLRDSESFMENGNIGKDNGKSDALVGLDDNGEQMKFCVVDDEHKQKNNKNLTINIHGITGKASVANSIRRLQAYLRVSKVRLIYRGRNINSFVYETPAITWRGILSKTHTNRRDISLLCLASDDDDGKNNDKMSLEEGQSTSKEQSLIMSIRNAAAKISNQSYFEITDQYGNNVSMTKEDRLLFLTSIGFHGLGQKHIREGNPSSALIFLLEADEEWSRNDGRLRKQWEDKVDNYGLLQLDIAWVYLKLESFPNLPDSLRRLEVAEKVLRKQVNVNFVTLAVAQAEMGNAPAVPPLAIIFSKLFLLQGVAYAHDNQQTKSEERFDWSMVLMSSLRSIASMDKVQRLQEATGASEVEAISALRRSQGNADAAAERLADDERLMIKNNKNRKRQLKLGLCQDEEKYVDLEKIPLLKDMLRGGINYDNLNDEDGFSGSAGEEAEEKEDGEELNEIVPMNNNSRTRTSILAVGLLRLANNDIQQALDIYRNEDYRCEKVQHLVNLLDNRLYDRGLATSRKKRSRNSWEDVPVDEVGLASLISLGFSHDRAKEALQKNNGEVETAILWLSEREAEQLPEQTTPSSDQEMLPGMDAVTSGTRPSGHEAQPGTDLGNPVAGLSATPPLGQKTARGLESSSSSSSSSSSLLSSSSNSSDLHESKTEQEARESEAIKLLKAELGQIQERDIMKDYIGSNLDEEWALLQKYQRDSSSS